MGPVSTISSWMKDLLSQKSKDGTRKISPATAKRAQSLLNLCEAMGGEAQDDIIANRQINTELLRCVKSEMERRFETEAKYASCFARLQKALEEGFYIRYGDYYAVSLSELRRFAREARKSCKEAQKKNKKKEAAAPAPVPRITMTTNPSPSTNLPPSTNPPPSPNPTTSTSRPHQDELAIEIFLREPRATIENNITIETKLGAKPMTNLVSELAELADLDIEYVLATIKLYTTRNGLAYANLGAMAKARQAYELAGRISEDLKDLEDKYEHIISKKTRDATRVAILQAPKLFFEKIEFRPDGGIYYFVPWPISADGRILREECKPTRKPEGFYDGLATLLGNQEKD
ncbi:hypothetical protein GGR54DRAFT_620784 [Hypoxylon sp. NC1633]|nr:hypothetical protein GGR54DRAFT_620784 [Hypoxylon sp. NC1633]